MTLKFYSVLNRVKILIEFNNTDQVQLLKYEDFFIIFFLICLNKSLIESIYCIDFQGRSTTINSRISHSIFNFHNGKIYFSTNEFLIKLCNQAKRITNNVQGQEHKLFRY